MDSQTIFTIIATGILFCGLLYGVYRSIKYNKNLAEQKNRIDANTPEDSAGSHDLHFRIAGMLRKTSSISRDNC